MSSTPASTRPDSHPADIIVEAFAALRARYSDAPAVVERMLAGDDEAIQLGRAWLAEVASIDARLGNIIDDALKLYELTGLAEVADTDTITRGEADPREILTKITITPEIIARWSPVAVRRTIVGNERYLAKVDERVAQGAMSVAEADKWHGEVEAENERLTAELATLGGAR